MKPETRKICSKCHACANHPEDRINGKCVHCNTEAITIQVRTKRGWKSWKGETAWRSNL